MGNCHEGIFHQTKMHKVTLKGGLHRFRSKRKILSHLSYRSEKRGEGGRVGGIDSEREGGGDSSERKEGGE